MAGTLADYLAGGGEGPRTFTFDAVQYPPNDHPISEAGKQQIRDVVRVLKAHPRTRFIVHGHIDGSESEQYTGPDPYRDYTLSELRADCVYRRLTFRGISRRRMQMIGQGASDPIAPNDTPEGRAQNRRVAIEIVPSL